MEDFITYGIAVKLKEKGFNEQCLAYYTKDSNFYYNTSYGSDVEDAFKSYNSRPNHICGKRIDAPTISQVLKWLREKKKLYVSIMTFMFKEGWCYEILKIGDGSTLITTQRNSSDTYEDAAIAGVNYCLENLI